MTDNSILLLLIILTNYFFVLRRIVSVLDIVEKKSMFKFSNLIIVKFDDKLLCYLFKIFINTTK